MSNFMSPTHLNNEQMWPSKFNWAIAQKDGVGGNSRGSNRLYLVLLPPVVLVSQGLANMISQTLWSKDTGQMYFIV